MSWYQYDSEKRLRWVLNNIKIHCILWYDNIIECSYCGYEYIDNLLIHHKEYFFDSVIYKSYYEKYPNLVEAGLYYHSDLLREVMKRPENFQTLCYNCHSDIHGFGRR